MFGLGITLLTAATTPLILCAYRLMVIFLCVHFGRPVEGRIVTSQTNVRNAAIACFRPRKMIGQGGNREMWIAYRLKNSGWAIATIETSTTRAKLSGKENLLALNCCRCCCSRCHFQRAELPFSCFRCIFVLWCDRLVDLLCLATFSLGLFLCLSNNGNWWYLLIPIIWNSAALALTFSMNCCFLLHQSFPDHAIAEWLFLDEDYSSDIGAKVVISTQSVELMLSTN